MFTFSVTSFPLKYYSYGAAYLFALSPSRSLSPSLTLCGFSAFYSSCVPSFSPSCSDSLSFILHSCQPPPATPPVLPFSLALLTPILTHNKITFLAPFLSLIQYVPHVPKERKKEKEKKRKHIYRGEACFHYMLQILSSTPWIIMNTKSKNLLYSSFHRRQ